MAGSDDDPLFGGGTGDFELDLGPRRRKPAEGTEKRTSSLGRNVGAKADATPPMAPASPAAPPSPDLDLLDLESVPPESLPSLELESVPAPASPPRIAAADPAMGRDGGDAADTPPGEQVGPVSETERKTKPATFDVLPPTPTAPLPTLEVAAVAEYGPAPGFLGAIPYAIHVYGRRKELSAGAEDARRHRKTAEIAVETALALLGRAVVERADGLDGALEALTDDLVGAKAAVQVVGESQEQAARADVNAEQRRRTMTEELETSRREIAPFKDRETKLTTQLKVRQTDLARARGGLQRAEIEQRNSDNDPAVAPDRAALAVADRERRLQEVAVAEHAERDLLEKLAEIKRQLAEKLGREAQLENDLHGLGREKEQTRRAQLASESHAAREARRALALLARRAIAAAVATSADAELTRQVARADEDLARRRRRERITRAAIDSYDKGTVYQGVGLLGGAALVVLIFVLFVLARSIF